MQAMFLGTDYNFAYSQAMREVFAHNALDAALCEIRVAEPSGSAQEQQGRSAADTVAVDAALTIALSRWAPQVCVGKREHREGAEARDMVWCVSLGSFQDFLSQQGRARPLVERVAPTGPCWALNTATSASCLGAAKVRRRSLLAPVA